LKTGSGEANNRGYYVSAGKIVYMVEIDPSFPADRVLTEQSRANLMSGFRAVLSTGDEWDDHEVVLSDTEVGELVLLLTCETNQNTVQVQLLLNREDHPELVTDDVADCPHHVEGEELSILGELGSEYVDLEKDLVEVAALMCDLPEYKEELDNYTIGRTGFRNLTCYDGLLNFSFMCHVPEPIITAYSDYMYELGERIGLPIDPSVEELTGSEEKEDA
jgi:hypothetical protein